jgi:hypothetical protein
MRVKLLDVCPQLRPMPLVFGKIDRPTFEVGLFQSQGLVPLHEAVMFRD